MGCNFLLTHLTRAAFTYSNSKVFTGAQECCMYLVKFVSKLVGAVSVCAHRKQGIYLSVSTFILASVCLNMPAFLYQKESLDLFTRDMFITNLKSQLCPDGS